MNDLFPPTTFVSIDERLLKKYPIHLRRLVAPALGKIGVVLFRVCRERDSLSAVISAQCAFDTSSRRHVRTFLAEVLLPLLVRHPDTDAIRLRLLFGAASAFEKYRDAGKDSSGRVPYGLDTFLAFVHACPGQVRYLLSLIYLSDSENRLRLLDRFWQMPAVHAEMPTSLKNWTPAVTDDVHDKCYGSRKHVNIVYEIANPQLSHGGFSIRFEDWRAMSRRRPDENNMLFIGLISDRIFKCLGLYFSEDELVETDCFTLLAVLALAQDLLLDEFFLMICTKLLTLDDPANTTMMLRAGRVLEPFAQPIYSHAQTLFLRELTRKPEVILKILVPVIDYCREVELTASGTVAARWRSMIYARNSAPTPQLLLSVGKIIAAAKKLYNA